MGVSREEILGKDLMCLEGNVISRSCALMVIESRSTLTMEQKLLQTGRTIFVTCTPIFDDDGDIVIIISNNRDFNELAELKNKLAQKDKIVQQYEKN